MRRFIQRIKNLFRWLPTIWNDQDWDDYYIWEILKIKLKHQAEYIRKHDRYTMAQYDANKMKLCVRLIEKIQSEEYDSEYIDYYETDIEWVPSDTPGCVEAVFHEVRNDLEDYFDKYPIVWRKFWVCGEEDFRIARQMAQYNHQRAKRLLFTLMERHIERWWD